VREFLRRGLLKAGGNWKRLCEQMKIEKDYHKFMSLVKKYDLKIDL